MTDLYTRLKDALADRYRIERELGHGGMATVYLAMDLRHDRNVAVKVLRPELAAVIGAERFLAEIKTTAALQHPHILPLFDSGEVAGQLFYVMPLIEGESLRDRLTREKQLPIADAVRIASEVASALDYAHRRGIIHRDIKPENILLHDGRALVADFGIALAASKAGSTRMTETGMSLGTPHYMAPEQAMGEREITARADIYALGCVTYEMLTAEPPFQGATAQAIIARVMTERPRALTLQRHTIPSHVEAAVLTAIEKLPADRFATAAEFAAALASETAATRARAGTALRPGVTAPGSRRLPLALGAALVVTTALALWGWMRPQSTAGRAVRRYAVELTGDGSLSTIQVSVMALSADGGRLAYLGRSAAGVLQLWIRDRDQLHARPLPGTERASSPAFSPDGKQIAFYSDANDGLMTMSLEGGSPTLVTDSLRSSGGCAWGRDDFIYCNASFGGSHGIVRVPAHGGQIENVTTLDSVTHAFAHIYPVLLPSGRGLVYAIFYGPTRATEGDIAVVDFKTHTSRVLLRGIRARYLPSGHLLVGRPDGSAVLVPFDEKRLTTTGPAVPVLTGITVIAGYTTEFDVSERGDLVYYAGQPQQVRERVEPVWVSRSGAITAIDSGWIFNRPFNGGMTLSPDGRSLAVAIGGEGTSDIWIKQLTHGPLSRLTFEDFLKYRPTWSPDGREVTYIADPGNNNASIYRKRSDGSGTPERLYSSRLSVAEALWSHDGKWLVVRNTQPTRDISALRPGEDTTLVPIVATAKFEERAPTLSPDGRFIAYQSDESGRDEIYVRPFPKADDGRWQLSIAGGAEPLWSRSGREVFYRASSGEMMTVPVTTTPSFSPGSARPLFDAKRFARAPAYRAYDVTPDDQRFVMLRSLDDSTGQGTSQLVFVDNWSEELRTKLQQK